MTAATTGKLNCSLIFMKDFSNDWFDVEGICMFTVEAAADVDTFTNSEFPI